MRDRNFFLVMSGAIIFGLLCGCERAPDANKIAIVPPNKGELQALQTQIDELSMKVYVLENSRMDSATFDPTGARSYQRVDSNVGTFLVVLNNVEPYLDGQKITLLIGNPSAVVYSGFKLNLTWGERLPTYEPKDPQYYERWAKASKSTQNKEIVMTEKLRPGAWNKVTFPVAPAKADSFGRLSVSIAVDSVELVGGK